MSERDWPAVLFRSAMASLMTVRPFACAQTRGVAAFHMKSKRPEEKRAVSGEDYVSAARYLWRSEAGGDCTSFAVFAVSRPQRLVIDLIKSFWPHDTARLDVMVANCRPRHTTSTRCISGNSGEDVSISCVLTAPRLPQSTKTSKQSYVEPHLC